MKTIIGILLITIGVAAYGATTKDLCQLQISERLLKAVTQKLPGYRAPLSSDNLAEDIESNIKEGGNGCLGVAVADFDGDGTKDFLLGLTSLKGDGALVIVALTRRQSWDFSVLDKWKNGRARLYVAAEKPGLFKRVESLDGPLQQGEKESMHCNNWAALFGETESSGVVYCYAKNKWHHVWVSD